LKDEQKVRKENIYMKKEQRSTNRNVKSRIWKNIQSKEIKNKIEDESLL